MMWDFNPATLATYSTDADLLAKINAAGKTQEDLNRMLGGATFDVNGQLTGAQSMTINIFLESNREQVGGRYDDPRGRDWEENMLTKLGCDNPICDDYCTCGYGSSEMDVFVNAQRSRRDVFGTTIRGDVGLINAAFFIMIIYLILNLGGLCHKIKSRALLALGCILSIVLAGAAGYGIAMWFQTEYTPVMSVLPFVLLGIGVDDSFVIMNCLDGVSKDKPVPERIAIAISHAGVSIMITSMTDFVAFAISSASSLPALAAFCLYAALAILMLFVLQITVFTAFATFDTRRVDSNLIDCCPCICKKGCPCCPVSVSQEVGEDGKDPNQLCCAPSKHKGGCFGNLLENRIAPILVKTPVAATVVFVAVVWAALCGYMMSELKVEDAMPKFIPDDSYVSSWTEKNDRYFGTLGQGVNIITLSGDYFSKQAELLSIGSRLDQLSYMQPSSLDSFVSWAAGYNAALKAGSVMVGGSAVTVDAAGHATVKSQYFAGLNAWLNGAGAKYKKDIIWTDRTDPQNGIAATRIATEFKSFNNVVDDKLVVDSTTAVEVMDGLRDAVSSWNDMPGGAFAYTYMFLSWEVFRIIKKEMFQNVSLCLAAVFLITLIFLAHPGIAILVLFAVAMTIIEVLGCMHMWGLAIDNVSVIQVCIAVGLAVDYSAHIGHCFMTKSGTRGERVIASLGDVGAAVMNGGMSTFLAVMLLALSKSYVFRVLFQTFFLTVVLGLAHGMLVLPAILSLVGPEGYAGRAAEAKALDPAADKMGKTEEN
jgi:predicted RND superfamily exporter protein